MAKSLYICYFGVREPLVQTQVLPYLGELRKGGHEIFLLTFEPELGSWTKADVEKQRERLAESGIRWHALAYHKRPSVPATLFDLANGTRFAVGLARREKIDIFHVRGHTAGPIGALAKKFCGGKLLFDIRGFLPEEYTDAGVWQPDGFVYKTFKKVESWLMKRADGFVVLTEAAKQVLFPQANEREDGEGRPVEVIPCCLDFSRVPAVAGDDQRQALREELGWSDRFVIAYVGSLGGLYLTDQIIALLKTAKQRNPSTAAMILTKSDPQPIAAKLNSAGFAAADFLIKQVSPEEVNRLLPAAGAAVSMVKESYSSKSRSPTKAAEYLAAGLPIISSPGVGDLDALIKGEKVGAVLDEFSEVAFAKALEEVEMLREEGAIRQRCVEAARRHFDLETIGGTRYRRLYERMLNGGV